MILLVSAGCIEPFELPNTTSPSNVLIVEGFLNAGTNKVSLKLSRASSLSSTKPIVVDATSTVYIEENGGIKLQLNNLGKGFYEKSFTPNPEKTYRLEINSGIGIFLSEFVPILKAPEIDSVTWRVLEDGVSIRINSQDPTNQTRHFLWNYTETWEYRAAYRSTFIYDKGTYQYRDQSQDIYKCYRNIPSNNILVGSTIRLEENIISENELLRIPPGSEKLLVKYSILINQLAITPEAYDFWQLLKKNTESLGSLFDPQPSKISGNIYGTEGEEVIGYFYASSVTQKRLTIDYYDLPDEVKFNPSFPKCEQDTLSARDIGNFDAKTRNLVTGIFSASGALIAFTTSTLDCTDCLLMHADGTRQKPIFW